jgi:vacuolar-type H+-ATPase subunit I/STV1
MGAKKKGGGKKKKENKEDNPLANLSIEEQVSARTIEWKSLQQILINETEAADRERAAEGELRTKTIMLTKDLEEEKKIGWDVTCDMTRQFKSMQQEKDEKIKELGDKISANQVKIAQRDTQLSDILKEKDAIIREKDDEIRELRRKIEEMSQKFSSMLKETLDQMKEKIELVNKSWKDEMETPMLKRLEEFVLNK